jgi:glutamate N-acetyltransferase/amino-acid N-acetyltransferase
MAVGLSEPANLKAVAGIKLGTAAAGIKYPDRQDLVLIELAEGSQCSAVFTLNAFCAAPVQLARLHLAQTSPRYLLINSGNANAGTGAAGLQAAQDSCAAVAETMDCSANEVLPFSTGVIGEPLPVNNIATALPAAKASLSENNWLPAAQAIMTTDTVAKAVSKTINIDGKTVTVTGMAKGAGMIRPDMATMLAYIATDACIDRATLDCCLREAVAVSFNRITVDGDTSTNDACVLMATARAENTPITESTSTAYVSLCEAVTAVCTELAQALIRDGEGANRFITIDVEAGRDVEESQAVAYTIAHSPLVKTALFAGDPNWGRILAAVGRAGVTELDINTIDIYLDDVCIVSQGGRDPAYTEEQGQKVMSQSELTIRVVLGRGSAAVRVWTCDLSYDYVRINAEYRS